MEFQTFEEKLNSIMEKWFTETKDSMIEFYNKQQNAIDEGLELIFSDLRSYLNSTDPDAYPVEIDNSNCHPNLTVNQNSSYLETILYDESDSGGLKTEITIIDLTFDEEQRTKGNQNRQEEVLLILPSKSQKLEFTFGECVQVVWESIIWNWDLSSNPNVYDTGQNNIHIDEKPDSQIWNSVFDAIIEDWDSISTVHIPDMGEINSYIDKKLDNLGIQFLYDIVAMTSLIDIYTRCRDVDEVVKSCNADVDFSFLGQEIGGKQNWSGSEGHSYFRKKLMNTSLHIVANGSYLEDLNENFGKVCDDFAYRDAQGSIALYVFGEVCFYLDLSRASHELILKNLELLVCCQVGIQLLYSGRQMLYSYVLYGHKLDPMSNTFILMWSSILNGNLQDNPANKFIEIICLTIEVIFTKLFLDNLLMLFPLFKTQTQRLNTNGRILQPVQKNWEAEKLSWFNLKGWKFVTVHYKFDLRISRDIHEIVFQFLAYSKSHEELCSKREQTLQIIAQHGEKIAGVIQLQELQNATNSRQSSLTSQISRALLDLMHLTGEVCYCNILIMYTIMAKVFYNKGAEHTDHTSLIKVAYGGWHLYSVARDGDLVILGELLIDCFNDNKFGKGGLRAIFERGLNGARGIAVADLLRYVGQGSEELKNVVDLFDIIAATLKLAINLNFSLVVHNSPLTTLVTEDNLQEVIPLEATIEVQFSYFRIIPNDLELLFSFPIQLSSLTKNNFRYCVLEIMFDVLKDRGNKVATDFVILEFDSGYWI